MSLTKQLITVFGATGLQGGSVVSAFLPLPNWTVRAVTRDTGKPSAQALRTRGAEMVSANLDDKASLVAAMRGADAVFAVTNYWESMDAEKEVQQGRNLVDAAEEAAVGILAWSSLPNVMELTKGALPHVYHFDSKAAVESYARKSGVPSTFVLPAFYASNLPGQMFRPMPPNNSWTLAFPSPESSTILPLIDIASDFGRFAKAAILDKAIGKRVLAATEYLTATQVVDAFKKAYPKDGEKARYYEVERSQYIEILKGTGLPEFAAVELCENMELLGREGYYGGEGLEESLGLLKEGEREKLVRWEDYVKGAKGFAGCK